MVLELGVGPTTALTMIALSPRTIQERVGAFQPGADEDLAAGHDQTRTNDRAVFQAG